MCTLQIQRSLNLWKSKKKTDKNDARILARLLRTGDLPESYLPTKEIDDMKTMIRYRRSLSEDITAIKNRIHAVLTRNGISISSSDIFGKRSLQVILDSSRNMSSADKIVLADLISQYNDINAGVRRIQNQLASMGKGIEGIRILITVPGIDYYAALGVYSEIGDITRFPDAEHLSSYTGIVPRVDQSGNKAIYGHITKSGPSVLRFFLVNSVHSLIKLSPTFKKKYRKLKKRIGKNRAIIATARKLAVVIFKMLSKNQHFVDDYMFQTLYERKLKNMESRAKMAKEFQQKDMEKIIGEVNIQSQSIKLLS
ncbi:MAG: IS110 family transposase [Candidatus Thermoplasmatota archaeon]|nr:IS110 family transposase [Candidatus Thermoplasmatota archaeon]